MHHFINEFKIVTRSNLEEFIECCKELNSQLIKLEDVDNWKRYLYFLSASKLNGQLLRKLEESLKDKEEIPEMDIFLII